MANLFDGAEKIDQDVLVKLIVDMHVYRIKNYLKCDYYKIKGLLQKQEYKEARLENVRMELQSEYNSKPDADKRALLRNELMETLKRAGSRGVDRTSSDELLSSKITKQASKSFSSKLNPNMSIPQMNDLIFAEYPLSKKEEPSKVIERWRICSVTIILLILILTRILHIPAILYMVLMIAAECGVYYLTEQKIAQSYINHFLWICASHYGKSFEGDVNRIPLNQLSEEDKKTFERRLRVYHSLAQLMDNYEELINEYHRKIKSDKERIVQNKTFIQSVSVSQDTDNSREITDKQTENRQLEEEIFSLNNLILEKESGIKGTKPSCEGERQILCDTLRQLYRSHFGKIVFKEQALIQFVSIMSIEDIEITERRLMELDHSDEPTVIASADRGGYMICFALSSGGTGKVFFLIEDRKVKISGVERSGSLREAPISAEEIRKILAEDIMTPEIDAIIKNYESEISNANHSIQNLESSIANLQENKKRLSGEIKENQREITRLSNQIEENNHTINSYKNKIAEGSRQKEKLNEKIKNLSAEKDTLENKLKTVKENRRQISQQMEELQKKINEQERMLQEKIGSLNNEIHERNVQINDLQQQVKQYQELSENKKDELEKEIEQYEKIKRNLELSQKEKEKLKKQLEMEQSKYDNLLMKKKQFETTVETQLNDKDQEIKTLNSAVSQRETQISELKNALDAIPKDTMDLVFQIDNLKHVNMEMNNRLDHRLKELTRLENVNFSLHNTNQQITEQLEDVESTVKRLESENTKLKSNLTSSKRKEEDLKNQKRELMNQLKVNQSMINKYESGEQKNNKVILELKQNNESFQQKMKELEAELKKTEKQRSKVEKYEKEISEKKKEIASLKSKLKQNRIPTQGHYRDLAAREEFENAIKNSKKYVYIVSPWVAGPKKYSDQTYDENDWKTKLFNKLCDYMKDALNRGVEIRILYGYNDQYDKEVSGNKKDYQSMAAIKEYKKRLGMPGFKTYKANTHEKLIIVDDQYFLIGSYNVLSFSAPYDEDVIDVRHEVLFKSDDALELKALKSEYFDDSLFRN